MAGLRLRRIWVVMERGPITDVPARLGHRLWCYEAQIGGNPPFSSLKGFLVSFFLLGAEMRAMD